MADDQEEWMPVVGFEDLYQVSNRGRVRSLGRWVSYSTRKYFKPGRILKPGRSGPRGYPLVVLARAGVNTPRLVHSLVLEAFVGPRPPGADSLHANDVADDNRLENLSWGSRSQNLYDSVRNGRHRSTKRVRL